MQLALRTYVNTGVALAGATALAVTPLLVTPEVQLRPTPIASLSGDLHLTSVATDFAAAVNAVIDGFVGTTVEGVNIFNAGLSGGTSWLQQGVTLGGTLLGAGVSYPFDAAKLISGGMLTAMTDVLGVNPITSGITDIVNGFVGPNGAGEIIASGLRSAISGGALVVNSLIGAGSGLLGAAVNIPAGALGEMVTGFQNALTDFAAGDTSAALADIVGGFTGAFGVVTTGLTGLFTAGVQVLTGLVQAGIAGINLAIQTPIAAGSAIVNGFINAFSGIAPMAASTLAPNNTTPLRAASLALGTSANTTTTVTTDTTVTPTVAASLAPSTVPTAAAALPKRSAPSLPSAAATTAVDVTGTISQGLKGLDLGAGVSTTASGGTSKADASTAAGASTSSTGAEHSSPTAKRVAPHFGGTNPGKHAPAA